MSAIEGEDALEITPSMILVDTSVWVEFLRATGGSAHLQLRQMIREEAPLAATDPVVLELLAGAGDEGRARELRRFLLRFAHLPTEGLEDYERAAALYRTCRKAGETVRSLTDCLIAAVAIRTGTAVFSHDRDFDILARHTGLELAGREGQI